MARAPADKAAKPARRTAEPGDAPPVEATADTPAAPQKPKRARAASGAGRKAKSADPVTAPAAPGEAASGPRSAETAASREQGGSADPVTAPTGATTSGGEGSTRETPASGPQGAPRSLEALAAKRVAIEGIDPSVDGGRFAAKAVVGREFAVEADVFCDGHERYGAALVARKRGGTGWSVMKPMRLLVNDRWRAVMTFDEIGAHEYAVQGWRDLFATWRSDTSKKHAAGQAVNVEIIEGRGLVERTLRESDRLTDADTPVLNTLAERLEGASDGEALTILMDSETEALMARVGVRANLTTSDPLPLWVDREKGLVSAWYELFPRSQGPGLQHGTFDDVIARLPYVKDLGFDVLYFPPIHPIGRTNRKGKNNTLNAEEGDVGSPYAIGSEEGGFDALHPELGGFEAFDRLVRKAREMDIEIAMDVALNASPDHPWIKEHPDWFERRPDGTIKYAENPPKKYEDIVNFRYYMDDGRPNAPFWEAIRDMFLFWIGKGVDIFRVDNPHTKPYPFWEWIIEEVHARRPEAIFLSEAFTRPKVMKHLAKRGFTQSYTYYTWRNEKWELEEYLTQLTTGDSPHVMRPNFFTNTPDINPIYNQRSGRPGFRVRAIMAATLVPSWGLYNGFELCDWEPMPGKEEYLNSEKYEIRQWDYDAPGHIKDDVRFANRLRAEHPALRQLEGVRFYQAYNDNILYYARFTPDLGDFVLFAVNLDPHNPQGAAIEIPLWEFGLPDHARIEARDLVLGTDFVWEGKMQHVWLTPHDRPYAVWALKNPSR